MDTVLERASSLLGISSKEKFFSVGLDGLYLESLAPCDLFRKVNEREYLFLAKKGSVFDQRTKSRLLNNGIKELHIREENAPLYFQYLKDELISIVRDPVTASRKKAEAVHASCREILRRVFDDPRASFISVSHEIITPTVDLIVNDDVATRCLIDLTAYDHSTFTHSTNVGIFSIALAKILYRNDAAHDMNKLGAGFFLHDLGKCKVPIEIINKPGPLTEEERLIINRHPGDGCRLLKESGYLTEEAQIITLQHHEREDGKGYPYGLKEKDIHPYSRICRLADVYEALTSDRPYHKRHSTFESLKMMKQKILNDMDSDLLAHFIKLFMV